MLEWMGKQKVVNHHNDVPFHVLDRKYSFDAKGKHEEDNGSENMIIHGDNLVALKSLLPRYEGQIKCIYIDPPYNTGNEGWVYNDNVNDPQIKKWFGEVVGKEGEDFSRHDKWLCMMYPRLKLLQKLLADDGVIFVSIDDNEFASLRLIMDEIFGRTHFIGAFKWNKTSKAPTLSKTIRNKYEYILCFCKKKIGHLRGPDSYNEAAPLFNSGNERSTAVFPAGAVDCKFSDGVYKKGEYGRGDKRVELLSDLVVKGGKNATPLNITGRLKWTQDTINERHARGQRFMFKTPTFTTMYYYLSSGEDAFIAPSDILNSDECGVLRNDEACNELTNIFDGKLPFEYSKPVSLIKYLIRMVDDKDSIVLDSFAGSGTTMQAVFDLKREDPNSNRRCILIEMDEYAESVTAERVRRVASGYSYTNKHTGRLESVAGIGGDFSFYELGPQLMIDGVLNEDVPTEKIREYVYYTETKQPIGAAEKGDAYKLGVAFGVAYYFCYEKEKSMTLNRAMLKKIKTKAESYVVYADACTLSPEELEKMHITFKKIPRDVTRF